MTKRNLVQTQKETETSGSTLDAGTDIVERLNLNEKQIKGIVYALGETMLPHNKDQNLEFHEIIRFSPYVEIGLAKYVVEFGEPVSVALTKEGKEFYNTWTTYFKLMEE